MIRSETVSNASRRPVVPGVMAEGSARREGVVTKRSGMKEGDWQTGRQVGK